MRKVARTAVAASLILAGCDLPTDTSEALSVELAETELTILIGSSLQLQPQVAGGGADASGVIFSSSDEQVVQVSASGRILGVGEGEAVVIARLRAFEKAAADSVRVEVLQGIAFDQVFPDTVRFGQLVTVVGQALDPSNLSVLSVGGLPVSLHSWAPGEGSGAARRDTLRLFVPAGAASNGNLVGLHVTGASAAWPLTVIQEDIYEPNDQAPAPVLGPTTLVNPQLAFEPGSGFDWYRLKGIQGSFTVEVQPRLPVQSFMGNVALSAPRASRDDAPSWSIEDSENPRCNGLSVERRRAVFVDEDATEQTLRFPVMNPGSDSMDLIIRMFAAPAEHLRYTVRIVDGYQADAQPDAFEPNNHCAQATPLPATFTGTLSIDGPADMDWFRFTAEDVPFALNANLRCVRCENSNFLNLSVFEDTGVGRPDAPDALPRVLNEWSENSVALSVVLPPGDYFLAIHNDFYAPLEEVILVTTLYPLR